MPIVIRNWNPSIEKYTNNPLYITHIGIYEISLCKRPKSPTTSKVFTLEIRNVKGQLALPRRYLPLMQDDRALAEAEGILQEFLKVLEHKIN